MKRTKSFKTKKPKRIQDKINNPKVQEKFILSISGSNSEKAQVINKSNVWSSPASENKVKKFAFFSKGESNKARYWMTPKLFILFFNTPNPPIPENYFISHKFYSDKFVSFHLNPFACSNMIYFMDKVTDVLSKNELFERIILFTDNNYANPLIYEIFNKSSIRDLSVNLDLQNAIPEGLEENESEYSPTSSQIYKITKEDGDLDYSTTAKSQNQLSDMIKQLEENSQSSPSLFVSPPSASDSKNNSEFKAASKMKDVYLESTSQESAVSISSSFRSSRGRRSASVKPKKREKENNASSNNSNRKSNRSSTNSQSRKSNRNSINSKNSRTRRNTSVSHQNRKRNDLNSQNDEQSGNNFESIGSRNRNNMDSMGSNKRNSISPKNKEPFDITSSIPISSSPFFQTDKVKKSLNKLRNRNNPNSITDSYGSHRNQGRRIIPSIQETEYYDYYEEEEEIFDDYQNENSSNRQTASQRRGRRNDYSVQSIKSRNGYENSLNSSLKSQSRKSRSSQNYEEEEIDNQYTIDSQGSQNRNRNRTQTPTHRSHRSSPRTQNYDEDEIDTRYSMDSHEIRSRKRNPNRNQIKSQTQNRNDKPKNEDEGSTRSNGSSSRHKRSSSTGHRVSKKTITTTTTTTTISARPQPSSANTQRIKANRRSQSITSHRTNNTFDGSSQPARIRNSIGPSSRTPSITFDGSPTNHGRHATFASDHVRYNFNCSSLLSNSASKQANSEISSRHQNHRQQKPENANSPQKDENEDNEDDFVFDLSPNEEASKNNKNKNNNDDVKEVSVLKIVSDGTSSITKTAPELKPSARKRSGTSTQRVVRKSNSNFTKKITHTTKIVKNNSWNISIDSFDKPPLGFSGVPSGLKYLNESTNQEDRAINSDDSSSEDEVQEITQKDEAVEVSDSIDAALPSIDLKPDPIQKKE